MATRTKQPKHEHKWAPTESLLWVRCVHCGELAQTH